MDISFTPHADRMVATPALNHIDASNAKAFKDACSQGASGFSHVILDLSAVNFVDSTGLGALVAILKSLGEGAVLGIVSGKPEVHMLLQMTRLDSIFRVSQTLDLAMS